MKTPLAMPGPSTPLATKPNTPADVRKSYIVQYAPDGAVALHGDPTAGPPSRRDPCNDPQRQFPIPKRGEPTRRR